MRLETLYKRQTVIDRLEGSKLFLLLAEIRAVKYISRWELSYIRKGRMHYLRIGPFAFIYGKTIWIHRKRRESPPIQSPA